MALTLNKKCDVLLSMIEAHFDAEKRNMPGLLRSMYKPMFATIRMFLSISPEWKLAEYGLRAELLYEALQCTHETEDDLKAHFSELVKSWI